MNDPKPGFAYGGHWILRTRADREDARPAIRRVLSFPGSCMMLTIKHREHDPIVWVAMERLVAAGEVYLSASTDDRRYFRPTTLLERIAHAANEPE